MSEPSCITPPPVPVAPRRDSAQSGFSMIEALIAAAIIGFVAIGLIPLFARSMMDNMAGSDYTRVTNYSRSAEEDFTREPWVNFSSAVPSGSTQAQVVQYIDPASKQWVSVAAITNIPNDPRITWARTVTYQLFSVNDFIDNGLYDNPLDGGSTPAAVQLIQATIQVQALAKGSQGLAGARRSTTVRYLKAF